MLIICCDTNHAAFLQVSTTKIYFLFLEIRNPGETSSWAFSQAVSQGCSHRNWMVHVQGHSHGCWLSLFLAALWPETAVPQEPQHPFSPSNSSLEQVICQGNQRKVPWCLSLEETCFHYHMLLIAQSSHEYRVGKHCTSHSPQEARKDPWSPWTLATNMPLLGIYA